MALYLFENLATGETQDVFYHMKEAPCLGAVVEMDGQSWKRIPTTSQLATSGLKPIDPDSSKQFVEKTGKMRGSIGDMWDLSREQSEKRAARTGEDPVKKKYYRDYSKKRKGRPHLGQLAEQQKETTKKTTEAMKKLGISISVA